MGVCSEAQLRANKKWNAKQADIHLLIKPEIRDEFMAHARKTGESLTGFLVRAGLAQIERDTNPTALRSVSED